jgi:hypothetical protein
MKLPRIGQRVLVNGHNGLFVVIRIDESEGVADLELTTGTHFIEKNIPFNAIKEFKEDVSQAAARIVREATKD